jgi:SHS2 domain-containing protein
VTDLEAIKEKEERIVTAEGAALPDLLINFLRACLQTFNMERFLARSCEVMELQERGALRVRAKLKGERFEEGRHPYKTEIKAVTYHGAVVEERGAGGFQAVFILDL